MKLKTQRTISILMIITGLAVIGATALPFFIMEGEAISLLSSIIGRGGTLPLTFNLTYSSFLGEGFGKTIAYYACWGVILFIFVTIIMTIINFVIIGSKKNENAIKARNSLSYVYMFLACLTLSTIVIGQVSIWTSNGVELAEYYGYSLTVIAALSLISIVLYAISRGKQCMKAPKPIKSEADLQRN